MLNSVAEKKIQAAESHFSAWIREAVKEKKFAGLEVTVQPGNPEPHLLFNMSEKVKI